MPVIIWDADFTDLRIHCLNLALIRVNLVLKITGKWNSANDLTVKIDNKIDELSKSIEKTVGEKQEYAEGKISENPLAYVAGAFVGGVIVGYLMGRGKS